jgi:hypothetical protein
VSPPERLRESLLRQLQRGVHFDLAWYVALGYACRGRGADGWRLIFEEQRDEWERAYTRGETTFRHVMREVDADITTRPVTPVRTASRLSSGDNA